MLIIIIITDIKYPVHSIKLKKLPKSFLMMCKGSKEIKQYSE